MRWSRKRSDEALRESEERLSLAADSADAGLWVLDYATRVFWVTARTRSIFGFSPDEIITVERLEAAVHPDDWSARPGGHRAAHRVRAESPSPSSTGSSRRAGASAGSRPAGGPISRPPASPIA